jgi:serine/threonine protein kinase
MLLDFVLTTFEQIYTMAPEVLKGTYTSQADLWSVGVITYMLLSSRMPFYGRSRSQIVERNHGGQV